MKKILGLDLGTNSIGWALVEVDETNKPKRIIGMGSRIIPLSSDDRDQFQKGQAISKNQDRTRARTQRKGYDRRQLRRNNLKKILLKFGVFPDQELMKLPKLELWKLRSNAVSTNEDINKEQLGRILYMLNQKRGYKSARSEANQDKKDTDYIQEVKGRYAELKSRNITVGQYFAEKLIATNGTNEYFRVKEKVYPREAYIEEFDAIISAKKDKHSFLTEEVVNELRNEIIFYQRKLKSQKGLINICEFEGFEKKYIDKETQKEKNSFVGPRVAPKTSPLFQLCKIWELVNNISLKVKGDEKSKTKWIDKILTIDEKTKIACKLNQCSNLSYSELLGILNLKKEEVYPNKQIAKGLQGNITYSILEKELGTTHLLQFNTKIIPTMRSAMLVDKKTGEILDEREGKVIDPSIENEPLYQLWHTIYSIKDLEECKNALIKRFNLDEKIADKLSRIDFNKQAFGNKSNKAMRKIVPYLMEGYDYSQACSLAGYNHSNSLTKEENESRVTLDKLELLPKNSLRQPVVEKIINQMINVVNAIVDTYGKPEEIKVELARELKQSKDERNEADIQNSNNKKLNDEISKRLIEMGLPSTKRFIQKYKLIFPPKDKKPNEAQVANQCIYCGKSFNLVEAIGGDNFDVDHIVPQALLFDDSQTNKVLVHRSCNSAKTNKTAYDYIATKGQAELDTYLQRVDDWFSRGILTYGKMQRLKVSHEEYIERKKHKKETEADKKLWENFIDRQLRETQYISRKSREILQKICKNVSTTEGSVTAKLRNIWGWDDVLMNLQLKKYKAIGQTKIKQWTSDNGKITHQKEEIINWTKRDDHRHHAIDALVIACTQQGFIQRFNTLNSSDVRNEMKREIDASKNEYNERLTLLENYLLKQKPFSTSEVENVAQNIFISFKAGKKVATGGVRKVKIDGKKKVVQTEIVVPRGALHEQFVYGKIKAIDPDKKPLKYLFENPDKIIDLKIRTLVKERLVLNENDSLKAFASLEKNPIYLNVFKNIALDKAACYMEKVVIKYKIQDLKAKDVPFIVDEKVKKLVKNRLDQFPGKEKEAFKNVLWFNEKSQIPIRTVRCFTDLKAVEPIKKDESGRNIGFAKPGSNHHIAIYTNTEGNKFQHICTLWNAVERKKYKLPTIVKNTNELWSSLLGRDLPQSFLEKLPADGLELDFSMQQNEMFILGLSLKDFEEALKKSNKALLSDHLYLVWSVSDNDYWFRHHLETKNSELKKIEFAKESRRYFRLSISALKTLSPIKVRINHLGEITKIGE